MDQAPGIIRGASAPEPGGAVGLPSATVPAPGASAPPRPVLSRAWVRELLVLAAFLVAGALATWPRAADLTGKLPRGPDQGEYVWNMWWIAHQVVHLGNPWSTSYIAAPAGIQLGYDTLTPLLGLVMTPVTLLFGPSASYNLLAIVIPGLAGYAMWRAARLWLPGWVGPMAAGAFYGLSGMLAFQDWYHQHTAAGCVFLPLTLEAAVRLKRAPTIGRGVILGVILGASMLVDQEFAVLTVVLAALVLIPWLARRPGATAYRSVLAGAITSVVVAGPQLAAMVEGFTQGHAHPSASQYVRFAAELPGMFAPSPRLAQLGLISHAFLYRAHTPSEGLATFGVVLPCWR